MKIASYLKNMGVSIQNIIHHEKKSFILQKTTDPIEVITEVFPDP